jgi:hypothetical protein
MQPNERQRNAHAHAVVERLTTLEVGVLAAGAVALDVLTPGPLSAFVLPSLLDKPEHKAAQTWRVACLRPDGHVLVHRYSPKVDAGVVPADWPETLKWAEGVLKAHGLHLGAKLGAGSFGTAYRLGDKYVVKITRDPGEVSAAVRLLAALRTGKATWADFPALVHVHCAYGLVDANDRAPRAFVLITDLVKGDALPEGTLHVPGTTEELLAGEWALESPEARRMLTTVRSLYRVGVPYHDLHADNVIVGPDGHWKLIDLGYIRLHAPGPKRTRIPSVVSEKLPAADAAAASRNALIPALRAAKAALPFDVQREIHQYQRGVFAGRQRLDDVLERHAAEIRVAFAPVFALLPSHVRLYRGEPTHAERGAPRSFLAWTDHQPEAEEFAGLPAPGADGILRVADVPRSAIIAVLEHGVGLEFLVQPMVFAGEQRVEPEHTWFVSVGDAFTYKPGGSLVPATPGTEERKRVADVLREHGITAHWKARKASDDDYWSGYPPQPDHGTFWFDTSPSTARALVRAGVDVEPLGFNYDLRTEAVTEKLPVARYPFAHQPLMLDEGDPFVGAGRGSTPDELVDVLTKHHDLPGARQLGERWAADYHDRLMAATSTPQVLQYLEAWRNDYRRPAYDQHEAEQKLAQERKLQAVVDEVAARRARAAKTDPGPVSSPAAGRAWAAGSAVPHSVYHATTSGLAILQTGLRAREDLRAAARQARVEVLGGGPENVISTTEDLEAGRHIAAAMAAMNEAYTHPREVAVWFDRYWLPLLAFGESEAYARKQIAQEDARPESTGTSRVKVRINTLSYFYGLPHGHHNPMIKIPIILSVPARVDPSAVGLVTAYANVDAVIGDKGILAGVGAGQTWGSWTRSDLGTVERPAQRGGPVDRGAANTDPKFPYLRYAATAHATENKSERGEIRFAPENLTVVGFEPMLNWREVLMPAPHGTATEKLPAAGRGKPGRVYNEAAWDNTFNSEANQESRQTLAQRMDTVAWEVGYEDASGGHDQWHKLAPFVPLARSVNVNLREHYDAGFASVAPAAPKRGHTVTEKLSNASMMLIAADMLIPDPIPGTPGPITMAVLANEARGGGLGPLDSHNGREHAWLTWAEVEPAIPVMRDLGVSAVARSPRGFLAAFRRAGGDRKLIADLPVPHKPTHTWDVERHGFIQRHLAEIQAHGESLWDANGNPTRRALAFVAWAYHPERAKWRAWLHREGAL